MITPITEGMTPAEFITAMNNNFNAIKYSATSLITIAGSSSITTISGNFSTILGETTSPLSMSSITGGLKGSDFAGKINANFARYSGANMTYSVGSGKNYTTINAAITRAISGNNIIIDEGTFDEHLDLTTKRLNLIGSGTRDTILYYHELDNPATIFHTVDIATNSTFSNLVFQKNNDNTNGAKEILHISACSPIFDNCKVASTFFDSVSGDIPTYPMLIENGSVVTFTNSTLDCVSWAIEATNYHSSNIKLKDTSIFNFQGDKFLAQLVAEDDSVSNINVDYYWTGDYTHGIQGWDNSIINLKINIQHKVFNRDTGESLDVGQWRGDIAELNDSCQFNITGAWDGIKTSLDNAGKENIDMAGDFAGSIIIKGLHVKVYAKDLYCPYGQPYFDAYLYNAHGVANTTKVILDHCYLLFDANIALIPGGHIIEDDQGAEWEIINESQLIWPGDDGVWGDSWGQSISIQGAARLKVRNSKLISHLNYDCAAGRAGYNYVIRGDYSLDMEDSEIITLNWDGHTVHYLVTISASLVFNIRLKNVKLTNVSNNGYCFTLIGSFTTQKACLENVTVESPNPICEQMTEWNILTANCPN
jgi:hypothetical protein